MFLLLLPICGYSQDRYLVDWDASGAHGDDERISEESMKQLVQFLWYIIIDIAATK